MSNHLNEMQHNHAPQGYANHNPHAYPPVQNQECADTLPKPHANKPKPRKRGRFLRFTRGYLQISGALVNLYLIVILLVQLFIMLGKHISLV
ncbi:MAG: hypothetical protein J6K73_06890 [Clostridia bacterium]|nr:hypothetical protein [Clostridia bacterium]MBP3649490.1 hypothetical protein [Clostridia bacterium]